ncbi:hypothetical protein D3C71_1788710 [compost metagenome]
MPGQTGESKICAQVIKTAISIIVAMTRHDERLDRYPVAGLYMANALAYGLYDTAKFMTENLRPVRAGERMRLLRHEDRAIGIFVQVRAADAAELVFDEHLTRTGLGSRIHILDA